VLPARLVATAALLGLLAWRTPDFDWDELVPEWTTATAAWLGLAAIFTAMAVLVSAWRWRQVLVAMGMHARLRRLVSHYFAGQFVSNVLPSTIGGDVVRVSRLSRDNNDPADSFASVVLERLTGWLVLPLITIAGFAVNPGLRELGATTAIALLIALGTLLGLGVVLVVADHERLLGRYAQREGWRRFIGAVHVGVQQLRNRPGAALSLLAVGMLYQLILVLAALAAAHALDLTDVGPTALLAFLPAVLVAQVAPISISGLGVREGAFVLFLAPLGVPAEQAVALGLVLYLLNLAVGLLGAPAFAVGGRMREAAA
jgi:hypothetical protein